MVVVVQVSTSQKSTLFGTANILRKLLSVGGHCLDRDNNNDDDDDDDGDDNNG